METLTVKYASPPPPTALDPANQPDYQQRLRAALEAALLTAGQDEPGGVQVVRAQTAVRELVRLIAFAAYKSPDMAVPSRMRGWCDRFAKELRAEILLFQRAEEAGETADAIYVDEGVMEWPR